MHGDVLLRAAVANNARWCDVVRPAPPDLDQPPRSCATRASDCSTVSFPMRPAIGSTRLPRGQEDHLIGQARPQVGMPFGDRDLLAQHGLLLGGHGRHHALLVGALHTAADRPADELRRRAHDDTRHGVLDRGVVAGAVPAARRPASGTPLPGVSRRPLLRPVRIRRRWGWGWGRRRRRKALGRWRRKPRRRRWRREPRFRRWRREPRFRRWRREPRRRRWRREPRWRRWRRLVSRRRVLAQPARAIAASSSTECTAAALPHCGHTAPTWP